MSLTMRLTMSSTWAPEKGETSPRKVCWQRNETDAKFLVQRCNKGRLTGIAALG